jgi:hypothetical protein
MGNLIKDGGAMLFLGTLLLGFSLMLAQEQGPIDRAVIKAMAALRRSKYRVIRGVVIRNK